MNDKAKTIVTYILLFIGVGVLNYPGVSNLYNRLHEGQVIRAQEESIKNISAQELANETLAAHAYNEKLEALGKGIADVFSGTIGETDSEYESLLNINGNGVMGYIEIADINVCLPIAHGTSSVVLERMAGHVQGSSLPVGGQGTHSIISAHRGLPSAILFSDLDQMKVKDVFLIHVLGEILAYEVDQIETVLPAEVSDVQIEAGEDYVTLLTCTPYGINSHRLLIRGTRIPYEAEARDVTQSIIQSIWGWLLQQKILLISLVVMLVFLVAMIVKRIRKRR